MQLFVKMVLKSWHVLTFDGVHAVIRAAETAADSICKIERHDKRGRLIISSERFEYPVVKPIDLSTRRKTAQSRHQKRKVQF